MRATRALIGESPPFRRVMETIGTVAPTRAPSCFRARAGTGKELFARALHDQSPRHDAPFVSVNCAAMPEGLVESELFGHEKGAFTGATPARAGAFERAHSGTLLLDEIGEMRLDLQAKLLRVLQEQEFERVGGTQPIKVDVRLVATTNRDLKAEVDARTLPQDLYYRLNVVPIRTPPLRDRREDIPRLVQHFMHRAAEHLGTTVPSVAPETIQYLQRYRWPGNVRELANSIERAVILCRGPVLLPDSFDEHLGETEARGAVAVGGTPSGPVGRAENGEGDAGVFDLDQIERQAIERALIATGGNRTKAAKLLGISERTLRNKLNVPRAAIVSGA